jgi:hypothetical protein
VLGLEVYITILRITECLLVSIQTSNSQLYHLISQAKSITLNIPYTSITNARNIPQTWLPSSKLLPSSAVRPHHLLPSATPTNPPKSPSMRPLKAHNSSPAPAPQTLNAPPHAAASHPENAPHPLSPTNAVKAAVSATHNQTTML